MEESTSTPAFKIGLSLAGAVSAGAYTAGVLDFLIEALDCWTVAQTRGDAVPTHRVSLEAVAGASAGSLCAALLAIVLPYRFPHVRVAANGALQMQEGASAPDNPLYHGWVEAIDIRQLLSTSDLARGEFDSLLNCEAIDACVQHFLRYSGERQTRPYVARPFVARMALGNLRGVPYRIDFRGNKTINDEAMIEHSDHQSFLVGGDPACTVPAYLSTHARLAAESHTDLARWQALGDAAVASGAFPLFLKPRLITREVADYGWRHLVDSGVPGVALTAIPPAWKNPQAPPSPYAFACIDAGMYNNEPFELAHEVIAGGPGKSVPHAAEAADGAVLMIAPFVSTPHDGAEPVTKIDPQTQRPRLHLPPLQQLMPLFWSLIMQSRFKPLDLAMAYDESVYSRFVIAPTLSKAPEASSEWIAGGALQGFLGFFCEDFRKHDFQLGRRNCQQFLREHFTLPADNPIVRAGYAALDDSSLARFRNEAGQLPIIPLIDRVAIDEELMAWPAGRFATQPLMPAIQKRLDAIFQLHRKQALAAVKPWLQRTVLGMAMSLSWAMLGRPLLKKHIAATIEKALHAQAL